LPEQGVLWHDRAAVGLDRAAVGRRLAEPQHPTQAKLQVVEDRLPAGKGVYVQNLSERRVNSTEEVPPPPL